jgi:Raf kinase inhibitor-like YbhB/YbcL family protein
MTNRSIIVTVFFLSLFTILNPVRAQTEKMKLTSPAFKPNKFIPAKFTCEGVNINPQLDITGIPAQAQSLALIVDDPDAPMGTWVHWIAYNIPIASSISENSAPGKLGKSSFNRGVYGGPCPPFGTHRYFFKIYALDCELKFEANPKREELEKAMRGHILAQAELIGLYIKSDQ